MEGEPKKPDQEEAGEAKPEVPVIPLPLGSAVQETAVGQNNAFNEVLLAKADDLHAHAAATRSKEARANRELYWRIFCWSSGVVITLSQTFHWFGMPSLSVYLILAIFGAGELPRLLKSNG